MKKLTIILIMSMLLLAGCELIEDVPSRIPGLESQPEESIYGGEGSIDISIINPKESGKVLKGYSLEPIIRVKNLGGSEAEGKVCITGLDQDTFSGFSGCECLNYMQLSQDNAFDDIDLKYGPYSINADEESKHHSLTAINRFRYSTSIKSDICISADIYENPECSADINAVTSGPITIDSIEETIIPINDQVVSIVFSISIENDGQGNLWPIERLDERCSAGKIEEQEKKITAEIIGFPVSADISCEDARLEDEEATITCKAEQVRLFDQQGDYVFNEKYKPEVIFQLEYGYETRESRRFSVE